MLKSRSLRAAIFAPPKAASSVARSAALDNHVAAARASIPTIVDSSLGTCAQVQIVATQPDMVEFVSTIAKAVDPAAAGYVDTTVSTLQSASDSSMFPQMETAGFTVSPKARFTCVNCDGAMLWSRLFEAAS